MPEWNLKDLFSAPDGDDFKTAFAEAEQRVAALEKHRGQIAAMDGKAFGASIADFEAIREITTRIESYAQLYLSTNVSDPARGRFAQDTFERLAVLNGKLLFFTLEINRLDDAALAEKMKNPGAARYAPWVRDQRVMCPHQLSDDLEKLFLEKATANRAAWVRLFDQARANLRVKIGGEELTMMAAGPRFMDPKSERRKEAGKALGAAYASQASLDTLITNVLAKDKAIEDEWRKFARPVSSRNLANLVEDEVVDALVSAVKGAYATTTHRYYKLKAKWFGVDKLEYWDRGAPLPTTVPRKIPWAEAQATVRAAYAGFSPKLGAIVDECFANNWIDAPAHPGKEVGAFCNGTGTVHPYIMLHYMGMPRDITLIAHEVGHAVHAVLAAPQGALMWLSPQTLCETASGFGEMLAFQTLLAAEKDPLQRRALLAAKVEEMLGSVVGCVGMHDFECQVHEARKSGELSPEQIGDIWMAGVKERGGPACTFDDEYKYFWMNFPHFVQMPFYMYSYAFGDCLVYALYDVYATRAVPDFEAKYIDMLAAGGKLRHKELLAPFGLDLTNPAFWRRGLRTIEGFIDELEQTA